LRLVTICRRSDYKRLENKRIEVEDSMLGRLALE
jgi:hypothetical protein